MRWAHRAEVATGPLKLRDSLNDLKRQELGT
jgi:hypothetical protein